MSGIRFAARMAISLLISALPIAVSAAAPVPDRAAARYYVAPPAVPYTSARASSAGQSDIAPPIIAPYLHPAERQAVTTWAWDVRTIFGARTVVYAGWSHGHLINIIHFLESGGQQTYLRQYVIHYGQSAGGDEVVTVEKYKGEGERSEQYAGQTVYLSKQVDSKLYLSSVAWTDAYRADRTAMDIQWTLNGVKAAIRQGQSAPASMNLKGNTTWLAQHFDLWNEFGLKFQ